MKVKINKNIIIAIIALFIVICTIGRTALAANDLQIVSEGKERTVDGKKYIEYTYDTRFLLDFSGASDGSKYIWSRDFNKDYTNLYCVKEGTSTSSTYTTVNGNNDVFTLGKLTSDNYNKFFNMLANSFVWRRADGLSSTELDEFIQKVKDSSSYSGKENYTRDILKSKLVTLTGCNKIINTSSAQDHDILELFVKDIQQTVIWDFTRDGTNSTYKNDNLCIYFVREGNKAGTRCNDEVLLQFLKDAYNYIWNSQNTDMSQYRNFDESKYSLSATTSNGIYDRSNISATDGGTVIGPITVNNPGKFRVTYSVQIGSQIYSGLDNVRISYSRAKGGSNSSVANGQIYIWVNTQSISDSDVNINIQGDVNFGDIPSIRFLKAQSGQNLVDVTKERKSKTINVPLKLESTKEFDLRLTTNIESIYSSTGTVKENVTSSRTTDSKLGYRSMVRTNTLQTSLTEEYKTNKVPVTVSKGDIIKYKITISNESELAGTATNVTAYIPEGLTMLRYEELIELKNDIQAAGKDSSHIDTTNYGWESSAHGTSVEKGKNYKKCVTEYLANTIIPKYNATSNTISKKELYIYCTVNNSANQNDILQLVAEIVSDKETESGKNVNDRDSVPNTIYDKIQGSENLSGTWRGLSTNTAITNTKLSLYQDQIYNGKQDDDDFESVQVKNFDLAITKSIASVKTGDSATSYNRINSISTQTLKEGKNYATYSLNKNPLTVVNGSIITYALTVYNEGGIDGYALEIIDYLPKGLAICDENGTPITPGGYGNCSYNGKNYKWGVVQNEDGTQTVICEDLASTKIPSYNNGDTLNSATVYLNCIADKGDNPVSTIYTNIAEIASYGYYVDSSTFISASADGIDIDSEENTLSDEAILEALKTKINSYRKNNALKYYYENQDDDDFENIKIVDQQFDLALRIYISELDGKKEAKMETSTDYEDVILNDIGSSIDEWTDTNRNNRQPKYDTQIFATANQGQRKSALYYHSKQAIKANNSQEVRYTIDVLNEGGSANDIYGIASEIKVNIPKGLEFNGFENGEKIGDYWYTSSDINTAYRAELTSNSDGTSTLIVSVPEVIKSQLENSTINENNILKTGTAFGLGGVIGSHYVQTGNNDYSFLKDILESSEESGNLQTFTFKCNVKEEASGYLTCVAEISDMYAYSRAGDNDVTTGIVYKYNKDAKTYENGTTKVTEKDSTPSNVDFSVVGSNGVTENLDGWYFSKVKLNYIEDAYVADDNSDSVNEEDDTDFETVLVNAPVEIKLTKTDESGNEIQGANLDIKYVSGGKSYLSENWTENLTISTNGAESVVAEGIEIALLDGAHAEFHVTETETPEGRKNVLENKILVIRLYVEGNQVKRAASIIDTSLGTTTSLENYNSEDISVSELQLVDGKYKIDVIVENPELKGKYNLNLIKTSTEGVLEGFEFKITKDGVNFKNSPFSTDSNGFIGPFEVGIESLENNDTYIIEEVIDTNSEYFQLAEKLKLVVEKESVGEAYTVKSMTVSIDGDDTRTVTIDRTSLVPDSETNPDGSALLTKTLNNVKLTNGDSVNLLVGMSRAAQTNVTITISVLNVKKTGSFDFKLIKEDNSSIRLNGAKFNVTIKDEDGVYLKDGEFDINQKEYITANVDGEDGIISINGLEIADTEKTYTITLEETYVQDGYVKISGPIEFTANVESNNEGLVLKKENPTDSDAKSIIIENKSITVTVENPQVTGKFDLDLIKYVSGTTIPLSGAEFSIEIKDENQKVIKSNTDRYTTGEDGHLSKKITGIDIEDENKTYTITIQETKVPEGYKGINGSITFIATSKLSEDGKYYELVPLTSTTIENTKEVTITKEEILIKAENRPEGPHKGVKEVENQDSGYYGDETQEWVIQTLIPSDINKYGKYIITDKIDERLVFSGIDNVTVKVLDGDTLTKDTDYQVTYDETSRTLKISFIEGNFVAGKNLVPGNTVEIRFNTTFALDNDGNIIALNQSVPNQAILTYGNNSGEEVSLVTEIPEVHTGWAGVYKYDKNTGVALEGAKFKIATSKENAEAGVFVKDANGNDLVAESNKEGIAIFTGLQFGEDAMDDAKYLTTDEITGAQVYKYNWEEVETKYYIVEIEAPEGFNEIEDIIEVVAKKDQNDLIEIEDLVSVANTESIYDLALRKFITAVDGVELTGEDSREPSVDLADLIDETSTTADYDHEKDPVLVANGQIVTYTLRVYNEGPEDAYASLIKDDIPEGLEFVPYTEGDGSINDKYGWKLVDENDNEVTDISKAKYIVTNYLAKDDQELNLIKGFNKDTMNELDSREVQVQFRVTEPNTSDRILINYAQISEETNKDGTPVTDRDSVPNEWKDEDDEDIEQVKVLYFDLALRKWVTQAIVIENGQTVVTETGHKAEDDPEDVVKVDLKKSKLDDVTVKFKYSIRITNQGEIAGEAQEISDYIPAGLKFMQEDNPDWKEVDGKVITERLKGVTLEPGESAEVEIILTWINSEENMGVMVNTAEISKDYNKYDSPDIDSTPNNKVPKEDDIDDAPVMLTVTTGSEIIMIVSLALGIVAIIGAGVVVIKRRVLI